MAETSDVVASEKRLYGLPGAEVLHLDPATVYESEIDPWLDEHKGSWEIEEWSVAPKVARLMDAGSIIERVVEWAVDDSCPDEHACEDIEKAGRDPEVLAAFENARQVMASKFNYEYADKIVTTHLVTWDDQSEPLLDGEPMYVKKAAV
jgi:hypothetical protein